MTRRIRLMAAPQVESQRMAWRMLDAASSRLSLNAAASLRGQEVRHFISALRDKDDYRRARGVFEIADFTGQSVVGADKDIYFGDGRIFRRRGVKNKMM